MTKIIGISAFYHDSAASLVVDGKIVAAVQEERFTRKKHDPSFPINSIKFMLDKHNLQLSEIDAVVFYEKPFLKFERLLETYIAFMPKGITSYMMAMPIWLKEKLFLKREIFNHLKEIDNQFLMQKVFFSEHHLSHAASAFFASPFNEAIILTIDGVGESATTSVCEGNGNSIKILKEIHFPHSLGLLYSAFTYYLGFKVNSGEYKVMGLAPYGNPKYVDIIYDNLVDLKDDGTFRLNQKYFNYSTGLTMTNKRFNRLFGCPVREPENENLDQFHMDIAASIQKVTEEIVLKITKNLSEEYTNKNLCLAGGVALNCVANGKILSEGYFENIWIQPAAGDAGGSVGAALAYYYQELGNVRKVSKSDSMSGSYLGPSYNNIEIKASLQNLGAVYEKMESDEILSETSRLISQGNVIGWFQGKMEFGPRALGARSILADPRSENMQKKLNLKIKYRESFRPFAPSIIKEDLYDWFDLKVESPYMMLVANVKQNKCFEINEEDKKLFGISQLNLIRSEVPAVTHIDYSARVQTVTYKTNPRFYKLLEYFKKITNCPILINTSFNVRGEPIVNTPDDAFNCFMGTEMDYLVIEDYILKKKDQDPKLKKDYINKYELD